MLLNILCVIIKLTKIDTHFNIFFNNNTHMLNKVLLYSLFFKLFL